MNETAKGNYAISMWGSCDLSTFVSFTLIVGRGSIWVVVLLFGGGGGSNLIVLFIVASLFIEVIQ